jgi:hypothetical protein
MDETQLVFIGPNYFTGAAKIAVLDFGLIKPFCKNHQGSHSFFSNSELEVLEQFPRNKASIAKNIPFYRCVSYVKYAGRKYSNLCNWLAISACACFICFVLVKDVRKLDFKFHAIF